MRQSVEAATMDVNPVATILSLRKKKLVVGGKPFGDTNKIVLVNSLTALASLLQDLSRIRGDSAQDDMRALLRVARCIHSDVEVLPFLQAITLQKDRAMSFLKGTVELFSEEGSGVAKMYKHLVDPYVLRYEKACYDSRLNCTGRWDADNVYIVAEVSAWRQLRQVTAFLSKMKVNSFWNVTSSLKKFTDNLARVASHSAKPVDRDILHAVNREIREWLKHWEPIDYRPAHGNGSVAEGSLTRIEKDLECAASDQLLDYVLARYAKTTVCASMPLDFSLVDVSSLDRTSRLCLVPKDLKTYRTICAEPTTLQYYQQGIMKSLYGYFRKSGFSAHFDPSDQTRNQKAAIAGSDRYLRASNFDFATIDLSMASDSVSWKLIPRLFANTRLLPWLVALRSKRIAMPDGEVIDSPIFAPMGSALCFPVQTLIFAGVVKSVWREVTGCQLPGFHMYIYGDDIVVPSVIAPLVVKRLKALGFIPNASKTYTKGPFRESCGIEAYQGFDVTPLYFRAEKLYNSKGKGIPSTYASLIDGANGSTTRGYTSLGDLYRSWVLRLAETAAKKPGAVPKFSELGSADGSLEVPYPTNRKAPRRWNKNIQASQRRFLGVGLHEPSYSKKNREDSGDLVSMALYNAYQGIETFGRVSYDSQPFSLRASLPFPHGQMSDEGKRKGVFEKSYEDLLNIDHDLDPEVRYASASRLIFRLRWASSID